MSVKITLSWFYLLLMIPSDILCEDYYDTELNQLYTTLALRDSSKNHTKFGCVWRPINNRCPDHDINFYFYSGSDTPKREKINLEQNFLRETHWDPQRENIIFIHGYGGGDGTFANQIIREAYIRNGSYNFFSVDWSPLARIPCYFAAVNNLNAVARCTALLYKNLRSQGIQPHQTTCVGHSLGAHGCGLISNHINFRMHRIVGLDPAGPMIPSSSRLRSGMANYVQIIHTNAGTFGDSTSSGRVNFCVNGGKSQPICDSTSMGSDICSHIIAVCYMAESIDKSTARTAQPCTRQCPFGPRLTTKAGYSVLMGQHTPDKTSGSYCIYTNEPPYCPRGNLNGHPWCCLGRKTTKKIKELAKLWNSKKPK